MTIHIWDLQIILKTIQENNSLDHPVEYYNRMVADGLWGA